MDDRETWRGLPTFRCFERPPPGPKNLCLTTDLTEVSCPCHSPRLPASATLPHPWTVLVPHQQPSPPPHLAFMFSVSMTTAERCSPHGAHVGERPLWFLPSQDSHQRGSPFGVSPSPIVSGVTLSPPMSLPILGPSEPSGRPAFLNQKLAENDFLVFMIYKLA